MRKPTHTSRSSTSLTSVLTITLLMALFIGLAMILSGCDKLTGLSEEDPAGQTGKMQVLLTDAPFPYDLVSEANVTITMVEAVSQDEERFALSDDTTTFNLLELQDGVTALLAEEDDLPAGSYSQMRLTVSDASVVLNNGDTFDLKVPSNQIKVNLSGFEVEPDESVALTLDFDAGKSFVVQGNVDTPAGIKGFLLKPVVNPVGWKHEEEREMEVEGVIEEVGMGYVVISGTRYAVTDDTEFDGIGGLDELEVGSEVELEFVQEEDGSYRALKITWKEDGEDSSESDDSNSEED